MPGLEGGFVGVDVFFVVSGYLITSLLRRELDETRTISLTAFYARRARRLLPAVVVTMLLTALAAVHVYAPIEQVELASTFTWTSLYGSNVYFARRAVDYLRGDLATNPLLHTWSLAVEEQFYLAWPLVLMAVPVLRTPRRSLRLMGFAFLTVASFALSWRLTHVRPPWAFFGSPCRAWEFSLGAAASVLAPDGTLRIPPFGRTTLSHALSTRIVGWAGLAAILASAVSISSSTPFPGLAALAPTLGTAMVLVVGGPTDDPGVGRMLSGRPLQEIGRLSYSWYLWHWPALLLLEGLGLGSTAARVASVSGSLLLAKISFHLVENPIRKSAWLVRRNRFSLFMALVVTGAAAAGATLWKDLALRAAHASAQQRYLAARQDLSPILTRTGCDTYLHSSAVVDCFAGSTSTSPAATAVLLGDSHSSQWFPAVEAIALRRNWRVAVLTKSSCPVLETPVLLLGQQREYPECAEWLRGALVRIAQLQPEIVIASSFTTYRSSASMRPLSADEWFEGTRRVFGSLSRASRRVVLLRSTPSAGFDVPLCLARRAWRYAPDVSCSFVAEDLRASDVYDVQQRAIAAYANVSAVDLSPAICPARHCDAERGGIVVFRDPYHLSATFSATLAPALEHALEAVHESPLKDP